MKMISGYNLISVIFSKAVFSWSIPDVCRVY
jgi:hypothetical protein